MDIVASLDCNQLGILCLFVVCLSVEIPSPDDSVPRVPGPFGVRLTAVVATRSVLSKRGVLEKPFFFLQSLRSVFTVLFRFVVGQNMSTNGTPHTQFPYGASDQSGGCHHRGGKRWPHVLFNGQQTITGRGQPVNWFGEAGTTICQTTSPERPRQLRCTSMFCELDWWRFEACVSRDPSISELWPQDRVQSCCKYGLWITRNLKIAILRFA